jgi:hypothetical protein
VLKGVGFGLELGLQSALSVFGVRSAYEQPRHEVVGRAGPARSGPTGRASPSKPRSTPAPATRAFGLLAGYIFGKNRAPGGAGGTKIPMTVPVEMRSRRSP